MKPFQVDVQESGLLRAEVADILERAAVLTLERHQAPKNLALTLKLADREEVRRLNQTFRGNESETDVLSFEMNETLPDGSLYLGDVVIALPVAEEQARAAGHGLDAELALLVIHGVLHLLGHDHGDEEEKVAMWAQQSDLLAALGLDAAPTES